MRFIFVLVVVLMLSVSTVFADSIIQNGIEIYAPHDSVCDIDGSCSIETEVRNYLPSSTFVSVSGLFPSGVSVTSIAERKNVTELYTYWDSNVSCSEILTENLTIVTSCVDNSLLKNSSMVVETWKPSKMWLINGDSGTQKSDNITIGKNSSKRFKIDFNVPRGSSGKFDIKTFNQNGSETILDPWYNSTFNYSRPIIVNVSEDLIDYQINLNLSDVLTTHTGLVGAWQFQDSTTGTTVLDMSGNGNNGTLTNMNKGLNNESSGWTTTGKFGNAMQFDGTDDYVDFGAVQFGITAYPFTFSSWIKTTNNSEMSVVVRSNKDDWNRYNMLGAKDGKAYLLTRLDGASSYNINNVTINDSNWHYLTGVFVSDTEKLLYVDGVLSGNITTSVAISTNVPRIYVGKRQNVNPSSYFNGTIDEVRIYNRSLSAEEIAQLYSNSKYRLDYGDIRFTAVDNTTVLPYWIAGDDSFWVKNNFTTALNNFPQLYMWYGNPTATSQSNITTTSMDNAGDDCSGDSFSSKWGFYSTITGYQDWKMRGGECFQENMSIATYKKAYINITNNSYIVSMKLKNNNIGANHGGGLALSLDKNDAYRSYALTFGGSPANNAKGQFLNDNVGWGTAFNLGFTGTTGYWYNQKALINSTSVCGKMWNATQSEPSWQVCEAWLGRRNNTVGIDGAQDWNISFDDFFVRKYASIEPTVSFGVEQLFSEVEESTNEEIVMVQSSGGSIMNVEDRIKMNRMDSGAVRLVGQVYSFLLFIIFSIMQGVGIV